MKGRIVLFGATGYTGQLVAEELVLLGHRPVLAGRDPQRVADAALRLAGPGGPLPSAMADVAYPSTVHALVERGDVLISTVGPFARYGRPAVDAVLQAGRGTTYLDSTGEPTFLADVYLTHHGPAERAGALLLPAIGYDFVPGQLAATLALERSAGNASRVDVGYFLTGRGAGGPSGGTQASLTGQLMRRQMVLRDGELVSERAAAHARTFRAGTVDRVGLSLGSSEHYTLRRTFPELRDVHVYLGWFGRHVLPLQVGSYVGDVVSHVPGARGIVQRAAGVLTRPGAPGPGAEQRQQSGSLAVAETFDADGALLQRVTVEGPNGYTLTARLLAWAASRALQHPTAAVGAVGPFEAFGRAAFIEGCREAGLVEAPTAKASDSDRP